LKSSAHLIGQGLQLFNRPNISHALSDCEAIGNGGLRIGLLPRRFKSASPMVVGVGVIRIELVDRRKPLNSLWSTIGAEMLHRDRIGRKGIGRVLFKKPHQLFKAIGHRRTIVSDLRHHGPKRAPPATGGYDASRLTMRFPELIGSTPTFSFEFFPPKTPEAEQVLRQRATELAALRPAYVSVTYGAGGSTRGRTLRVVADLKKDLGLNAAAHLTCVGHTRDELIQVLSKLREAGVDNLVVLRGDLPADQPDYTPPADGLKNANELVSLIRQHHGDAFGIAVAGYPEVHPEATDAKSDQMHLKQKVDAGADAIITQLFFDNEDFYRFRDQCEADGITVPIIAGLMPIVSRAGILRMTKLCGAQIPVPLMQQLDAAGEDADAVRRIGIDWATDQSHDLITRQVRGIHFYTLNRSGATMEIYRRLGAADSEALGQVNG
jgi:methylenetetrahydrofolate reductase (NADPH)